MTPPTRPDRVELSKTWSTIKHGTVTKNQKAVLWALYAKEPHRLTASRAHQARRTLMLRGLVDTEGRITAAGIELARGFRK